MGGWRCGYLRRSREGSDYTTINLYFVSHVFQSTLPRRERRPANGRFRCAPPHFNPRSREGSDIFRLPQSIRSDISIHAPAKGATRELRDADEWEVLFQSTLPRRERLERKLHNKQTDIISIHAPAKGATYSRSFGRPPDNISIHAPAKGATRQIPGQIVQHSISIHAPAKGATFAKLI